MPPLLPRGARAAVTVTVSCGAGRVLARCPLQCPTARPCRGPPGSSALSPRGRCRCAAAPAGCAAAGKPRHRRALGGGCAAPWPRGASRCIAERRGTWVAPGVRHRSTPGPLCLCRCISAVPIPCHPQQPNPTRPDPTPAVGQECCLCVRLPTAQHCTALHSTACGPAGTFPHRVPGLWGCGAVGLWGDGVEVLAGGCLQHMWCTAGTAPSPRRSGWGGSHCSMGLRAPITSSRSPIPVGLRRAAPPPKCPTPLGAAGCPPGPDAAVRGSRCPPQCRGSLRCRQPMAEGGGRRRQTAGAPPAAQRQMCAVSTALPGGP